MSNTLQCPRCSTALSTATIDDAYFTPIEVEQCDLCNGMWLSSDTLERVENVYEPVLIEFRDIPSKEDQYEEMQCPQCESVTMVKSVHERDKNVVIDSCPQCHGVWLDGGELEAIQKENVFLVLKRLFKIIQSDRK